ncbi:type II toxin-antitoxin system RelE/ParE family toxin [Serratia silvae]|uniref:Type II toxin-antitoxin system RelE/ParE family toxin n=1 Tax=Serratia silvae TaxID=2824122 RepID=A0ABT0K6Q8_9GAMM|nr:type II toxin-antitoxin system RelE/ParE family toxin [Serratia silvae]MCL1027719.1 type II toxin-antitoxin system RelE/ParE family toxin [Serratia silvae]
MREDPKHYRFNATLADYGLALRERLDKHEYRTLYEITGYTVDILLFLHTRQDLTSALRRHMLLS